MPGLSLTWTKIVGAFRGSEFFMNFMMQSVLEKDAQQQHISTPNIRIDHIGNSASQANRGGGGQNKRNIARSEEGPCGERAEADGEVPGGAAAGAGPTGGVSADGASPGGGGRGGGAGGAERATVAEDGSTAAAAGAGAGAGSVGGASSSDVPRAPAPPSCGPSRRKFRKPQKLVPAAPVGRRTGCGFTWAGAEASGGAAAGAGAAGRASADGAPRSPPERGLPPRPPGGAETPSSSPGGGRGGGRGGRGRGGAGGGAKDAP